MNKIDYHEEVNDEVETEYYKGQSRKLITFLSNKKNLLWSLAILVIIFSLASKFYINELKQKSILLGIQNDKVALINSALAAESDYAFATGTSEESDIRSYIDCDCEKEFKKEYPIVWSGEVMATFVSGKDFGVERFDKNAKYNKFYVVGQSKYSGEPGANVQVRGRLVGITCVYANTVFGECVGEVVADEVTLLGD